ncbi:MAG: hypothetical protein ACT4PP_01660, partial [Sporichthyaceae bacterium]
MSEPPTSDPTRTAGEVGRRRSFGRRAALTGRPEQAGAPAVDAETAAVHAGGAGTGGAGTGGAGTGGAGTGGAGTGGAGTGGAGSGGAGTGGAGT